MTVREYVESHFPYDPNSGVFKWSIARKRAGGRFTQIGEPAGAKKDGYLILKINGRLLRAHRVAWELFNGPIPEGYEVDHINRMRSDNRLSNLRLVNRSQNTINGNVRVDNKAGYTGVSFIKNSKKRPWHARIKVGGTIIMLGNYATVQEAIAARQAADRIYFKGIKTHRSSNASLEQNYPERHQ